MWYTSWEAFLISHAAASYCCWSTWSNGLMSATLMRKCHVYIHSRVYNPRLVMCANLDPNWIICEHLSISVNGDIRNRHPEWFREPGPRQSTPPGGQLKDLSLCLYLSVSLRGFHCLCYVPLDIKEVCLLFDLGLPWTLWSFRGSLVVPAGSGRLQPRGPHPPQPGLLQGSSGVCLLATAPWLLTHDPWLHTQKDSHTCCR